MTALAANKWISAHSETGILFCFLMHRMTQLQLLKVNEHKTNLDNDSLKRDYYSKQCEMTVLILQFSVILTEMLSLMLIGTMVC